MSSIVTINGKTHVFSGNNITINGDRIIVDGKDVNLPDEKNITIKIEGDIRNIEVEHCNKLEINGNVLGNVKTISGDVKCQDIGGNVNAVSGDITAKSIVGNTNTVSGDITTK